MDAATAKPKIDPSTEDRIDEITLSVFRGLGYKGRLPDELVRTFLDFKRTKDALVPGRLSAEGFAFVVTLFNLKKSAAV